MVYLIALVPAVLVYLVAAMTGTKSGLYWAAVFGIGVGVLFGSPDFLIADVAAVVVAAWLAHHTLDFKERPSREQSVDQWPLNPRNRNLPPQDATARATSSGTTPQFGPARWSTDETKRSTAPVRPQPPPAQSVSRERFQFYFVQERPELVAQQALITPENSNAYHMENVRLRDQLRREFPEADFGLSAINGRDPGMEDWNYLDVVHLNLSNIRTKSLAERSRKAALARLNAGQSQPPRRS